MAEVITVGNASIQPREYRGSRVVTFNDIDAVHERAAGTAGRTFRKHRKHFQEGQHFYEVSQPDVLRRLGFERPQGGTPASVILITERGYMLLSKTFTDDLAWKVQDLLVDVYFRAKEQVDISKELAKAPAAVLSLLQGMAENALALEATIEEQRPAVEFQNRVVAAEGEHTVREAAKLLGVGERWLFEHLALWGAAYRTRGSDTRGYLASHAALSTGRLEQRMSTYITDDGRERTTASIRITPKGLVWINQKLGIDDALDS